MASQSLNQLDTVLTCIPSRASRGAAAFVLGSAGDLLYMWVVFIEWIVTEFSKWWLAIVALECVGAVNEGHSQYHHNQRKHAAGHSLLICAVKHYHCLVCNNKNYRALLNEESKPYMFDNVLQSERYFGKRVLPQHLLILGKAKLFYSITLQRREHVAPYSYFRPSCYMDHMYIM